MPISCVRSLLLATTLLLLGGCGADDAPPGAGVSEEAAADATGDAAHDEGSDAFPVTVPSEDGEITVDEPPQAIVSLSPSSTELLYAVDAGDRVVAVDTHSDHPEEAPATDLSGFDPNVEAIADLGPDLVVASGDRNDLVDGLGALGIPVLVHPSATDLDDVWEQTRSLGGVTGQAEAAEELIARLEAQLAEIAARAPEGAGELTYYHELSDGYFSATSETFVGQLYGLLGLENIADDAPEAGDAGGFPQLSPEFVVESDPDLIFLAHEEADLEERPGWDGMTAVRDGHVVELDPDVASRWGPRLVEQVETALDAVVERLEAADRQ